MRERSLVLFTCVLYLTSNSFENISEDLLRLGLVKEFSEKELHCHSYNLKTYNLKRDWNNPKGWANPENFNKYRW